MLEYIRTVTNIHTTAVDKISFMWSSLRLAPIILIGASLSEPHTYQVAGKFALYIYIYIYIYPDMAKHQSKPQVYKSDIAPCGQI